MDGQTTSLAQRLAWIALFAAIVAVLISVLVPRCYVTPRNRVSRVRTDMRSMATAIEAYFVDNGQYPAWNVGNHGPGGLHTYNYGVALSKGIAGKPALLPNFLSNGTTPGQDFKTLTTPISYITSYVTDPFSPVEGSTFVYWAIEPEQLDPAGRIVGKETPHGWILISAGPDGDYDLPGHWDAYDPAVPQPGRSLRLFPYTYDPSNGTISNGDVWRVKQE